MREVGARDVEEDRFVGDAGTLPVLAVAWRILSLRFAFLVARVIFVEAKQKHSYDMRK